MVKFATFETAVNAIYTQLGKPKEAFNTLQQTGVSFLGGYIAGVGCAVVSHPADVMVSKLNSDRKAGEGAGQAVSRIYKNIGFKGLWNGLPVRILMIGTLVCCHVEFDDEEGERMLTCLTDCFPMVDLRQLQGSGKSHFTNFPVKTEC